MRLMPIIVAFLWSIQGYAQKSSIYYIQKRYTIIQSQQIHAQCENTETPGTYPDTFLN